MTSHPCAVRLACLGTIFAAAALSLCGISTAAPASSQLAPPLRLQCQHQHNPLAIAEAAPELSWRDVASDPASHDVHQMAYEIRVTSAAPRGATAPVLWQSGRVETTDTSTASHPYAGPPLQPQETYHWQVRVWDAAGHPTAWSASARWTQAPVLHARWIAADPSDEAAGSKPLPLFRKTITIAAPVRRALLYASGLGQAEFRINGAKVGDAELTPGWTDYRKTIYYDTYDVTAMLHPGRNGLGILVGNGMYRVPKSPGRYTKFNGSYGPPMCLAQLHLELADGKTLDIVTDESWKTHSGPITFSNTYGGEDYDARAASPNWDRPAFDDHAWAPVIVSAGPGGTLRPEIAPPIRQMHTYQPVKTTTLRPNVRVYDLGQNFAGWPDITAEGPGGSSLKLIPGELLNPDGSVSQHSSGQPQWYTYTLRGGGPEHWHPRFSYYGFRYVQVESVAPAGARAPTVLTLRGDAVHTSSAPSGTFTSSNDLLNRIHTLIVRAIENNAVSLFTDCPHREKLGWLEETHLLASAMLYDFDLRGLFAATARNIADAQKHDEPARGRVPEIAPQYVVFGNDGGIFDDSPEWGSAAVLAPWYVYQRDGDLPALLAQLDTMRGYVDYLGTRAHDGIVAYGLGDWYDIGPGEPGVSKLTTSGVTGTATYYQDLLVLVKVLALAGRIDESRAYSAKAETIRRDFNQRFFDARRRRYDKGSQTAQAMPLVVGLVPDDERGHVLEALVADVRARNNHVTAGDIGFHYVVQALLDGGRSDVLYDMLQRTDSPSYGYQLAKGATALTEAWDADPNSSQDHFMLGHAEDWFYRGLGGIQIDFAAEPARRWLLKPQVVGNLDSVRTSYESVWGLLVSNWHRNANGIRYEFEIPANATAQVELAGGRTSTLSINGDKPEHATGVHHVASTTSGVTLVLGSGKYTILAPAAPTDHGRN